MRGAQKPGSCGEGPAGLLTWFGLWFLTNQAPSSTREGGGLLALLPLLDLTWAVFICWEQIQGAMKTTGKDFRK